MKLKLGCPVSVTRKLIRRSKTVDRRHHRHWKIVELNTPSSGIFLGYRTIFNGYISYDMEDGNSFVQTEKIKVALVCLSERENPIYVPLDNAFVDINKAKSFIIEE